MAHDIKYIDKLVGDSLKTYQQQPETNWSKFQSDFTRELKTNFSSNFSNYGLAKNVMLSVVSMSILATGVFMYVGNEANESNDTVCKTAITKQIIFSNDDYKVKLSSGIENEDAIQENNITNSNKPENVVVRIEVPVYKKIEVRKEIIIKDSVQN